MARPKIGVMVTDVVVPQLGESISEGVLLKWHKADGQAVKLDDALCEMETDKANVDIPAKVAGVFKRSVAEGTTVRIGQVIGTIDTTATATVAATKSAPQPAAMRPAPAATKPAPASVGAAVRLEDYSPAVRQLIAENKLNPASVISSVGATGSHGRLTVEDVRKYLDRRSGGASNVLPPPAAPPQPRIPIDEPAPVLAAASSNGERREPMTKIRKKIAQRLVAAQQTAAILTTFNEIDLHHVMELRARYKEQFEKTYGVGLGLMSFFAKATVAALRAFPRLNASIDGDDIVYHDYVNLGIAVTTERGLTVPVVRNAQLLSMAKVEIEIKRLANGVRQGTLTPDELSNGTFTITNGGVFGSLLSTPILNTPQSGILGMHTIQKRPVVVEDQIVIRPMMYVALSYDHRLVDGQESVRFLVRVKELLEEPARLLIDV